jgi:tRNA-2-methylthio-N6-dimethylallyladenosine synthase
LKKGFHISTMGCQMNDYDSDYLAQELLEFGYSAVAEPMDADIILINTCSVRAKPDQKAVSLLGRMSALKQRKGRGLILGMTGCMAQKEGPRLLERFPQLDLVMGPREIGRVREFLGRISGSREKIVATDLSSAPPDPICSRGYFSGRISAHISIMQGCDNFCSYCIVPYVRGREVSRSPEMIFKEAEHLVSQGVKEITLLGQNVNSYRWGEWNFAALVRELGRMKGLERLRFTTSHPKDLSEELVRCFREVEKLCPHIHLPFQAGSDRILEKMRRGYTREEYMSLVNSLRKARPDIAVTSDVMVGFPGESGDDFEMTLDLIEKVRFDGLFSFKYSDREGTLAERLPGKVTESQKSVRLAALQGLQTRITLQKNRSLEGKEMEVIVEGQGKGGGQLRGRSGSNKVINFLGDRGSVGSSVVVKIKHGYVNSLWAEI